MMYHYTECGLDNVWLSNGYTEKKTAYGKAVSISNADELHKILAEDLVKNLDGYRARNFVFCGCNWGCHSPQRPKRKVYPSRTSVCGSVMAKFPRQMTI